MKEQCLDYGRKFSAWFGWSLEVVTNTIVYCLDKAKRPLSYFAGYRAGEMPLSILELTLAYVRLKGVIYQQIEEVNDINQVMFETIKALQDESKQLSERIVMNENLTNEKVSPLLKRSASIKSDIEFQADVLCDDQLNYPEFTFRAADTVEEVNEYINRRSEHHNQMKIAIENILSEAHVALNELKIQSRMLEETQCKATSRKLN